MPIRPSLGCQHPSCRGIAVTGTSYCKDHAKVPLEMARERDTFRRKKYPWRLWYKRAPWTTNFEPACLARDPLCKLQITDMCKHHGGDPSTVAHHVKDHKGNPDLFYDMNNLVGACKPCHDSLPKKNSDLQPVGSENAGKIFVAAANPGAVDAALIDTEDLSDVTIP
jgi:5-methylcytosine-specific restriction protein A